MKFLFSSMFFISSLALIGCGGGTSETVDLENRTATWSLKAKESFIHYTTVKQGDIAEPNLFSIFTGDVSPSGEAVISIALNSVQTNVDTRDERMKKLVFKTADYPLATISTSLPMATLEVMEEGDRVSIEQGLNVSMAGVRADFDVNFKVTRLGANSVLVESEQPIYVQAEDFGFEAGVAELQKLANLDSITPVVPVSFSLLFER